MNYDEKYTTNHQQPEENGRFNEHAHIGRPQKKPKHLLNIEGREIPWDEDTITTEQIAELGGWEISKGVIEIDKDNNERTLAPGEIIHLKPGQGFGKKHKWKRGLRARIEEELALLRQLYPDIQHKEHDGEDWFLIPRHPFPPGWQINEMPITEAPIAFKIVATYPTGEPYGFATPAGINFNGAQPGNTGSPVSPPFAGSWQHFSWAPDEWTPCSDLHAGQNLYSWVRSFSHRLLEGA